MNSAWSDWRGSGSSVDRLEHAEWRDEFLGRWHLPTPAEPVDLTSLNWLRSLMRRIAEALAAGSGPSEEDLAALNTAMAAGPVLRQIDSELHLRLQPAHATWAQVAAEIAASLARTLAEGEHARVRVCANPDCSWVFYDDTRSRTKRFCEDKSCGNLMKVRRYRARQKQGR